MVTYADLQNQATSGTPQGGIIPQQDAYMKFAAAQQAAAVRPVVTPQDNERAVTSAALAKFMALQDQAQNKAPINA